MFSASYNKAPYPSTILNVNRTPKLQQNQILAAISSDFRRQDPVLDHSLATQGIKLLQALNSILAALTGVGVDGRGLVGEVWWARFAGMQAKPPGMTSLCIMATRLDIVSNS
ncbi:hypothetical protein ElyMa_005849100 [Elysia marginata]|uniref:Uncharacterized protein n=1 Tax=Elysia marginata TaxID=1093978 RepID=A0AAV4G0A2_9GAST|nr:hypothetical protein ElyMa_005849100 [Elysia marginata]